MGKRIKKSLTIKNEIFLLSFLFLTLMSLIFSGIFIRLLYQQRMNHAKSSLQQCNSQIVTYTAGIFHENASLLQLLSRNSAVIHGEDPRYRQEILSAYQVIAENNANITYVYSGYANGSLVSYKYVASKDFNSTERPWYQAALETDGVTRLVYKDADTNEWLFSQCMKLVDGNGQTNGVISIDCSNKKITDQLSTKYQYESQRSFIIDSRGTVLIHPDSTFVNDLLPNYMDTGLWKDIVKGQNNYGEYRINGMKEMAYFEKIPETDFIVVTVIDAAEILLPIVRSLEYLLVTIIGVSIVLSVILRYILMYRFARPVMALERRIFQVANGWPSDRQNFSFSNVEIDGIANSIEMIVKDIARREEQRKAAEYLSFHDSMTQVYNRRYFEEQLASLDQKEYGPLCLICCDINGLKLTNDIFGHDAGDDLIIKAAKCLEKACTKETILARMGGDEFSMLIPHCPDEKANEILQSIKNYFQEEEVCGIKISASLGYFVKDHTDFPISELVRQADAKMYANKMKESAATKREMLNSILSSAKQENLITALTDEENFILSKLSMILCPESENLLKQSYWLRNIGLCSVFQTNHTTDQETRRHTETGYRVLHVFDDFRNAAGCVLHYTEHWDGSGWPGGLSGREIPLLSRILGVADAYFTFHKASYAYELHPTWYDPEIVATLSRIISERKTNLFRGCPDQ